MLKSAHSSNRPLPDMTQSLLRALVASLHDDINLLDATSTQLTADERLFQRVKKTALLVKLKSALSPVKELPYEILSKIFSHCVTGTAKLPLQRSSAPWNLIQVCSKWRGVALQVPNLWNNIAISFSSDRPQEFTHISKMLHMFLAHAGIEPISLEILAEHIQSSPLGSVDPLCRSIEDIVRPYTSQLQHLSIRPPDQFQALFSQSPHPLNLIQSVSLHTAKLAPDADLTTAGIIIPGGTPNLHKITISTDSATLDLRNLLFPWVRLTELRIMNTIVTYAGCHAALRQCRNLVSLVLGIVPGNNACLANLPDTRLRHLESLTVTASAEGDHGKFLLPFILPSLKAFSVTGGLNAKWVQLNIMIERSACSLERFEALDFWSLDMHYFFLQVPSLTELSFRCSYSSYPLKRIIPQISNLGLIPNLQILKCDLDGAEPVIELLEQRSQSAEATAIQSWVIYGDPEKAREMIGKSALKLARGMEIIFQATDVPSAS